MHLLLPCYPHHHPTHCTLTLNPRSQILTTSHSTLMPSLTTLHTHPLTPCCLQVVPQCGMGQGHCGKMGGRGVQGRRTHQCGYPWELIS